MCGNKDTKQKPNKLKTPKGLKTLKFLKHMKKNLYLNI